MDTQAYILSHREEPPGPGLVVVREDFAGDAPPADPPPDAGDWQAPIRERCAEIRRLVALAQTQRPPYAATKATYQRQMAVILDETIGPMADYADQIEGLLPNDPGPAPVPPPPAPGPGYDSFGGTWGADHGAALDLYPNGEAGPHKGYQFRCPAAGIVSRYSFGPGPLGRLSVDIEEGDELLTGFHLSAYDLLLRPDQVETIVTRGTMMHIAVLEFDQPQRTPGGYLVKGLWIAHVADGFATGRRAAGDPLAVCSDSGIEFPGAEAAHGHLCGTATGQLSPNGDVPGIEIARLLGFNPRVTRIPGPADYARGAAFRGKFR